MEDSMDLDSMTSVRPQNFLFGCELKADKKEYSFKGDDDENEHQLSLRTVSLGAGAKDELNIVEAEGMSYEGKPIKVILASLKPSVQPTVSLGGFEITPPVTLRLKSGSGPIYISGQHLVALDEDLESEEEDEDDAKVTGKRAAAQLPSKLPQKKARMSISSDEAEEEDDFEDEDDDDDEDEDEDDEDEEEESPVKKAVPVSKAQQSNQNGKVSKPSTPASKQKTPEKNTPEKKPQTPKTPKAPLSIEEMKAKMLAGAEKGIALPKLENKFQNFVKNCYRTEDPKIIQELWKWRQSLKEGK